MKDNREFLDGIYEKYEEYQNEKHLKYKRFVPVLSIATLIVTIFIGTSIYKNNVNKPDIIINEVTDVANIGTIASVDTFENFYELLKKQENTNTNMSKSANLAENNKEMVVEDTAKVEQAEYSQTNTQVDGVDEADIIKTDGKYIYYVADKKIVIVDIQNSDSSKKVSEIPFENNDTYVRDIYVKQDKLLVIASKNEIKTETRSIYETADVAYVDGITIKTIAIVYNIQNREKPAEERRIELEGTYISSRMIGDNIYFATSKYISNALNMVKRYPIEELKEDDYKPTYIDTAVSQENKYIPFNEIQYFDDTDITNYLIVAGFDIGKKEAADVETFLGAGETIYASNKNMYIAKIITKYDINTYTLLGYNTKIIKFKLDNGNITYQKDTTINGKILNQFSMDEDANENFRIATTQEIQGNTENMLYILDKDLKGVGNLTGLANGEKIYSVRYMGDKAYIVTFKQVDPLFVIDLSDPKNPQKLGELKIPGYSTYLHPYDENHIIGLGYDTKENGETIQNNGLKLSMFDITDVNNPKELFTEKIGNIYTNSDAIYNHKAILYLKQKNIIAFSTKTYQNQKNISKALLYEIDLNKGFILKNEYAEDTTKDYKKSIERIVFANGRYYFVSKKTITSVDESTWQNIKKVEIE